MLANVIVCYVFLLLGVKLLLGDVSIWSDIQVGAAAVFVCLVALGTCITLFARPAFMIPVGARGQRGLLSDLKGSRRRMRG